MATTTSTTGLTTTTVLTSNTIVPTSDKMSAAAGTTKGPQDVEMEASNPNVPVGDGDEGPVQKTAAQLKKDAKKQAKLDKFNAKKAKQAAVQQDAKPKEEVGLCCYFVRFPLFGDWGITATDPPWLNVY